MNDNQKIEQQLNAMAQVYAQLMQLGQAAKDGDQQAQAIIQQVQQRAQAMLQQSGTVSAKNGTKLEQIEADKCGGKAKKHLKRKECKCGCRVAECGSKLPKSSDGGKCTKHLKREGGKLITVDCNGNKI